MSDNGIYAKGFRRSELIPACTLSRDDLISLYRMVDEKVREAAEIQIRGFTKPPEMEPAKFDELIQVMKSLIVIDITIEGQGGARISGRGEKLFRSPLVPDRISAIYFDSAVSYRVGQGRDP